jgi:hypothetical protein
MRAKVRLLRHNGVRLDTSSPFEWHEGTLETETLGTGNRTTRRLVLRAFRSTPGMGVIVALHQPYITLVDDDAIRLRGLESVELDGKVAAVLQEWLVSLT